MFRGDLANVLKTFLSMQAPRPATVAAMGGGGSLVINQSNTFNTTFNGGDPEKQVKAGKAMDSSTKNASAQLARAIKDQR